MPARRPRYSEAPFSPLESCRPVGIGGEAAAGHARPCASSPLPDVAKMRRAFRSSRQCCACTLRSSRARC
eukprot:3013154-Pleurochrysis_carterae.AAC.1